MEVQKYNIKIAIIGDGGVGKTSIRRRYMGASFPTTYLETIGADFAQKLVSTDDGYDINYQIWDLAGQERYNRIREVYYIGVSALVIVFSVIRPDSLDNVKNWIQEVKKNGVNNIPIILIGNKIDLLPGSSLDDEMIQGIDSLSTYIKKELNILQDNLVQRIETSAKTGENISNAFDLLTEAIVKNIKKIEQNQ